MEDNKDRCMRLAVEIGNMQQLLLELVEDIKTHKNEEVRLMGIEVLTRDLIEKSKTLIIKLSELDVY